MKSGFHISLTKWHNFLKSYAGDYNVYVPVEKEGNIDYGLIDHVNLSSIVYNTPKPTTPLKLFFLPVKENVTRNSSDPTKKSIIVGVPSCDLAALNILDEIYLNPPYTDPYYKARRENTIIVGTDCYDILRHCHCNKYGVRAFPTQNHDLLLSVIDDRVLLFNHVGKGETLISELIKFLHPLEISEQDVDLINARRRATEDKLEKQNAQLPGYEETGELIRNSEDAIWANYSKKCVSCGGCAAICPTCTCFLLVDRPGFEKVRQLDACQYPGFSRIAAGEDHLKERADRFKNRYLCKYVWKPAKFNSTACTGCGRCIETCIGKINKNELFLELASTVEA